MSTGSDQKKKKSLNTDNWPCPYSFFKLATALYHLKAIQVIHADLKLENIMLVNHKQAPFRIKLIDFGLASEKSAAFVGSYIQSRFYRWGASVRRLLEQHNFD